MKTLKFTDPRPLVSAMARCSRRFAGFVSALTAASLFLVSCSLTPAIPVISDTPVERLVFAEASRIVAVTADARNFDRYRLYLSDFPRRDILGLSTGHRRIYISYTLAKLAAADSRYLWLLRQTLAHEVAHEIIGHAGEKQAAFNPSAPGPSVTGSDIGLSWLVRYRNDSPQTELQADLEGMKYWARLHWNCRIWVRILKNFQKERYSGDAFHPTSERLKQAESVCPADHGKPAPAPGKLGSA